MIARCGGYRFLHPNLAGCTALTDAIRGYDASRVRELLRSGVDPNCARQAHADTYDQSGDCKLYMADGTPMADETPGQATTPLRVALFRASYVEEPDIASLKEATELLLEAGADASSALEYAFGRYRDEGRRQAKRRRRRRRRGREVQACHTRPCPPSNAHRAARPPPHGPERTPAAHLADERARV